jgi:hypothetical protein
VRGNGERKECGERKHSIKKMKKTRTRGGEGEMKKRGGLGI